MAVGELFGLQMVLWTHRTVSFLPHYWALLDLQPTPSRCQQRSCVVKVGRKALATLRLQCFFPLELMKSIAFFWVSAQLSLHGAMHLWWSLIPLNVRPCLWELGIQEP